MIVKVKAEHADRVFGFNNSGKPLGEREDCHLLYADAKHHNLKHILDLFEEVDESTLLEGRGEEFIEKKRPNKPIKPEKNAEQQTGENLNEEQTSS